MTGGYFKTAPDGITGDKIQVYAQLKNFKKRRSSISGPDVQTQITASEYTATVCDTLWINSINGTEVKAFIGLVGAVAPQPNNHLVLMLDYKAPFTHELLTGKMWAMVNKAMSVSGVYNSLIIGGQHK